MDILVGTSVNAVRRYALAVFAGGVLVMAAALPRTEPEMLRQPAVWVLAALIVAGELLPITIRRGNVSEHLMSSSTFSFALLLYAGPGAAIAALVLASLIADLHGRHRWDRILFNIGQYAISLAAAGLVLSLAGHPVGAMTMSSLTAAELLPLAPAWMAIFTLNHVLVGVAVAIDQRTKLAPVLLEDLPFELLTSGVLLALAPIVVVVSARSLWLLPFLLLPVLALHRSTKQSVEDAERARHDPLTGLPHRGRFREQLMQLLGGSTSPQSGALIFVDLDRFGEINDTLGHRAGDDLLCLVAERLGQVAGDEGALARIGGDEFALFIPRVANREGAIAVAREVLQTMSEPFVVDQFTLHVRPTLGLSVYPDDGHDTETLLRQADVAIHVAKRRGVELECYSTGDDLHSRRRLQLANDLRSAIPDGAITVHFQPKADLRSNSVVGAEALARWTHPSLGAVGPDEFIPLAERVGLIDELTEHVLDLALEQCALWRIQGLSMGVAVNVSMQSVHLTRLAQMVAGALRRHRVPADALHLEITESTIMADPAGAAATLEELREMGIRLAVDDFGTGYSSLAHLKHLPVTQLKIDKAFVQDMTHDEADAAIVGAAIQLAATLGIEVVAEGVEQPEAWTALTELGCDQVQGYYLSRPLAAEEFLTWLWSRKPVRGLVPAIPATTPETAPPDGPAQGTGVTPLFKRSS